MRSYVQAANSCLYPIEDHESDSQDAQDERNSVNVDAFLKNAANDIAADAAQPSTPVRTKRLSGDLATDSEDSGSPGGTKRPRLALDVNHNGQPSDVEQHGSAPSSASPSDRADAAGPSSSTSADCSQDPGPRTGADIAADTRGILLASPDTPGAGHAQPTDAGTPPAQPTDEQRELDIPTPSGGTPLANVAPAAVAGSMIPRPPSLCSQVRIVRPGLSRLLMDVLLLPGTGSLVSQHI